MNVVNATRTSSAIFGSGAANQTITKPQHHHDFIQLLKITQVGISAEAAKLYAQKLTTRQIAARLGCSKSFVTKSLRLAGVSLRPSNGSPEYNKLKTKPSPSANPPYGFAVLYGELVKEPKEYLILIEIEAQWKRGQSPTSIADHLNKKQIKTRMGKKWRSQSIEFLIKRFKQTKNKTHPNKKGDRK